MQSGLNNQTAGLFVGSEQIIEMIRELSVRKSPDEPLPILSLVRPDLDEHGGFLADISNRWLQGTEPCVPHMHVDFESLASRTLTIYGGGSPGVSAR